MDTCLFSLLVPDCERILGRFISINRTQTNVSAGSFAGWGRALQLMKRVALFFWKGEKALVEGEEEVCGGGVFGCFFSVDEF